MSGFILAGGLGLTFYQLYYSATAPKRFTAREAWAIVGFLVIGVALIAAGLTMAVKGV